VRVTELPNRRLERTGYAGRSAVRSADKEPS
jgi:hypothetical protein